MLIRAVYRYNKHNFYVKIGYKIQIIYQPVDI